jgi:Putative exonuclease SbcCD, C subunit
MQESFAQDNFDQFVDWSGSDEESLSREIDRLQLCPGGPVGYRLRRIILINYWLYDQIVFDIPHGRIFLAGENTSGKSTVLTSAIPLALEGSLRPNRLDTFGEQYKSIEYYILGSEKSSTPYTYDVRTSYIALEFEWCDPDNPPFDLELQQRWLGGEREKTRFLTIGLGLYGKIDRKTHILVSYFVITDSSRISDDLQFIVDKRPLSQGALKQLLKDHGQVCEKQGEYEHLVSRYLFGFTNTERFHDLIDLLLILRQPNLSSELTLAKVHEQLSLALPAIPTEVTRRVINTINEIQAINEQLQRLQDEQEAVEELHRAQQSLIFNEARQAGCDYLETHQAVKNARSTLTRLQNNLLKAEREQQDAQALYDQLAEELQKIQGALQAIDVSEVADRTTLIADAREQLHNAEMHETSQQNYVNRLNNTIRIQEGINYEQERRFQSSKEQSEIALDDLSRKASQEAFWETLAFQFAANTERIANLSLDAASAQETIQFLSTTLTGVDTYDRLAWLRELEELHLQLKRIEDAMKQARETERTRKDEFDRALREFHIEKTSFVNALADIDRTLETGATTYSALADTWDAVRPYLVTLQEQEELFDDRFIEEAVEKCLSLFTKREQAIAIFEQSLTATQQQLQHRSDQLTKEIAQEMQHLAQLQSTYNQKQAEPEYRPEPIAHRAIARNKLAERGIPAFPLYALIDFAPHLVRESEIAGRIEYFLGDAGLLDALVVLPSSLAAASMLLAEEGLSDCLLMTSASEKEGILDMQDGADEHLGKLLHFDTAQAPVLDGNLREWQAAVSHSLVQVSRAIAFNSPITSADNTLPDESLIWSYGVLTGYAGNGRASVIGKETRLLRRREEIAELEQKMAQLQSIISDLDQEMSKHRLYQSELESYRDQVHNLLTKVSLYTIVAQLQALAHSLKSALRLYQVAREIIQSKQQERLGAMNQLVEKGKNIADLATNYEHVRSAITATTAIINALSKMSGPIDQLLSAYNEYHAGLQTLRNARYEQEEAKALLLEARSRTKVVRAKVQELERVSEDGDDPVRRRAGLKKREEDLRTEKSNSEVNLKVSETKVGQYKGEISIAQITLREREETTEMKQKKLAESILRYPVPQFASLLSLLEQHIYENIARQLLADLPREESFTIWRERLDEEHRTSLGQLVSKYHQHKSMLYEYGPVLNEQSNNITFERTDSSSPLVLLEYLNDQVQTQELLLETEESKLFENFLLQDIAEVIHTHIFRAQDWVHTLNTTLQSMLIAGDKYDLQWRPNTLHDPTKLGSHLARRQELLSKPIQTLTDEERELIRAAFQEEIRTLHQRQQIEESMNFEEALHKIFDYRDWRRFEIYITPRGGNRMLLDNKVLGGRSGAEKLFALYIPLFAALSALYDSAARGAPRLLALDEAFDKASVNNMQLTIEFLAAQNFQWIMTAPQINLSGTSIPVSIRYLMLHEKGSKIATAASSRTWQSAPSSQNEDGENEVE